MKASASVQWGSIAVSMDHLSFRDKLFIGASLVGIFLWAFPHVSLAQTAQETPLVFAITNNAALTATGQDDMLAPALAQDLPSVPANVPDPRVAELRQYLQDKHSPLADEAGILMQQYHYRLIIGIAFAESNFCKHQIAPNNCWGIGGRNPLAYESLQQGIINANQLIQKYHDLGMKNPQLMRNTWVGANIGDPNWALAVTQVAQEMQSQGL